MSDQEAIDFWNSESDAYEIHIHAAQERLRHRLELKA